jgi:hypothetical protein
MKLIPIFKIKIIYKSGATHEFEVYEFSLKNGTYSWRPVDDRNKPIELGGAEVAAVWQVGYRKAIQWSKG